MRKKIFIILAFVSLAVIAGVIYYTFRKSPDSVKNLKPDYIVEASAIVDEFMEDENLANQKYLDKTIQIENVVMEIEPGSDNTIIYLQGNDMGNISCQFNNEELKNTKVEAGQKIIVKGKCSGYIMDVVLNKCALIK